MALDDVGKRRLAVLDLVDIEIGDDDAGHRAYLEERLSRLNDTQRRICVRVLQFLRSQLAEDLSTEYERNRIDRTLNDSYRREFKVA